MKFPKLLILLMGLGFLGLAAAQPAGTIQVCLKGDHKVIPGQDLRAFTVSINGDQEQGGYFELSTAAAAQANNFNVTNPRRIQVVEPANKSFTCSESLDKNTRSVVVTILYPADLLPYCLVLPSSHPLSNCTNH